MSSRYSKMANKFFRDEKVRQLTAEQQRTIMYLFISPHGNSLGLFVVSIGYICDDMECEDVKPKPEEVIANLEVLINKGIILYDYDSSIVYIKNFLKYNPITNPNQVKGGRKCFLSLPKSPLLDVFLENNPKLVQAWKHLEIDTKEIPESGGAGLLTSESIKKSSLDIFEYWKKVMGEPESVFDKERKTLIRDRLNQYGVEACKEAIDGCKASEWHMGKNPGNHLYNGIDAIFKSADKVDFFRRNAKKGLTLVSSIVARQLEEIEPKEPLVDAESKFAEVHAMLENIKSVPPPLDLGLREERKELLKKQAEEITGGSE